ncbi:hypothetical protein [Bacillus cereus]|uniref:hypothetical protein n=1 Tax=Bacillus cereus TaxID=1396 RepID=UPI0020D26A97|nr:hypothetical protein [Bacillus cereus]
MWSSFLAGKEGIIQAVDCDLIKINVGINGSVVNKYSDGSFEVKTEQVFGNCPKYIQAKNFTYNETAVD